MLAIVDPPVPETAGAIDHRPHAIVIGSGFGGLAAAIRLGARGWRVNVLEKLDAPGGRAYVHRQDGFTFDAGPTIVTAPFLFEELWSLCGRKLADDVELRPMDPFYRIRFDSGEHFDCSADTQAMRREIARFAPDDLPGYDRFMAASEAIYRVGFERLGDQPFTRLWDMARCLPDLLTLQSWRSVYGLVSHYIRDPRLRVVFSFHPLLIGGNPFQATSVYALISHLEKQFGVHYAMGGTNSLVTGMAGLIAGQGNEIRCNAEVAEITVLAGRAMGVRLRNGDSIDADIVVSNADASYTYRNLLPPALRRRRWTQGKLARARQSMSLFVWYFGTDRRWDEVNHHTILLGPRYKPLLDDIFKNKRLAQDFSLYLHRPSATDPAVAPPGCDAFYALVPVPNLASGTDWVAQAEPYRQRIEQRLEETLLPGLSGHIVTSRITTPLDFQDRLLSVQGAAFGLEPILMQSAWFRPHNQSEELENLYLVGAGTHPGAGLPGVLSTARVLDRVVPDAAQYA